MFRSPRCVARFVIRIFLSPFLFIFLLNSSVAQAAPPTPSLSAPSTGYVNEVILVDGRRSTGVLNKPQTNGAPSVTIDFGDGFSANLLASGHAYRAPGTYTITYNASDPSGNDATPVTRTVIVSAFAFSGFFSPVSNLPTLNSVNAGRAIPVKFSLGGNQGLNIMAPDYPVSVSLNCNTSDPGVDVVETLTAGNSSLSYDPATNQYTYVWKTESSWAGTCRQLIIKLCDGTEHKANFKFK